MNGQSIIGQISDNILQGRFNAQPQALETGANCMLGVSELISLSMEKNMPPSLISADALDKTMNDIINRFKNEEYAFIELIARANLTGNAREILADHVKDPGTLNKGKILLATVEGEYHRHGKDIVSALSRGIGLNTIDLGLGVPIDEIAGAVKKHDPDFLGISASMRSTVPKIEELNDRLNGVNCREDIKIILGGYLATDETANAIDVDFRCWNISQTLELLLYLAGSAN
jgi:5-methyltetrahydrofolate--homocysteine methyltransferase